MNLFSSMHTLREIAVMGNIIVILLVFRFGIIDGWGGATRMFIMLGLILLLLVDTYLLYRTNETRP